MPDYFSLFNESRRPWLDPDSLKTFFNLSAEIHPDRVHAADAAEKHTANECSAELNAGYQCLREPRARLRHLQLELGAKPSRSHASAGSLDGFVFRHRQRVSCRGCIAR